MSFRPKTPKKPRRVLDIPDSDVVSTCTQLRAIRLSLMDLLHKCGGPTGPHYADFDRLNNQLCFLLMRLAPREGKS